MSDVETPGVEDKILHDGLEWEVAEILESMDGMHYLQMIGQENPY